ncbi:hypothetical protein Q5752_003102 [Cryptotrichosporon argae]
MLSLLPALRPALRLPARLAPLASSSRCASYSTAPPSASSSSPLSPSALSASAAAHARAVPQLPQYAIASPPAGLAASPYPPSPPGLLGAYPERTLHDLGVPGSAYSGRSSAARGGYAAAYGRVMGALQRAGVRRELRLQEYYEKPSKRKVRLASERHRRRFQEEVRQRVQMVQALRARK